MRGGTRIQKVEGGQEKEATWRSLCRRGAESGKMVPVGGGMQRQEERRFKGLGDGGVPGLEKNAERENPMFGGEVNTLRKKERRRERAGRAEISL